jgi:hypothetical protein
VGVKHERNSVHNPTLTNTHSGWTQRTALGGREETLMLEAISTIRRHPLQFTPALK